MARFKARARAVDMLGRQQIAGIPTAISELFKNAHDAYADHVEVDFFRAKRLLVLRDDGVGMSRNDFEGRWLTLGTESKVAAPHGVQPPPVDPAKKRRPVLGEKGIGRLAIAAIGPQVLVLTRAKEEGENATITAALLHWGLFGIPGVDLDQIEIPIRVFDSTRLPSEVDVRALSAAVLENFEQIAKYATPDIASTIRGELAAFSVDPAMFYEEWGGPSLEGTHFGTHFFIMPTDESLAPAIDGTPEDDVAPPLVKTLIGFTNTMTPGHAPPLIHTGFRDHKGGELVDELIGESAFFNEYEFLNADHHIEGRFDEFGQFSGTVTVYGEPRAQHVVPWTGARGRPAECGSFRINVAVVQGLASQSTLPTEDWTRMKRKMDRIGGLYIYRDGIRVLPYGNSDYDFLDMERQRSKSAQDYYFSFRRIFGVIEINSEDNSALVEKAGREGFRENKAYRQFREILKNFFYQIALDFFRESGTHAERYWNRRAELDRLEKARKARERQVSIKRQVFRSRLEEVHARLRDGVATEETAGILTNLRGQLAAASEREPEDAVMLFIEAEVAARRALTDIRERYRVVPPRGVGLPKMVRRTLERYRADFDRFNVNVFDRAQNEIEGVVRSATAKARVAIDRRVRFDRALIEAGDAARRTINNEAQSVRTISAEVHQRAVSFTRECIAELDGTLKTVLSNAARIDIARLTNEDFVAERARLEEMIQDVSERNLRVLTVIGEQLRLLSWSRSADESSSELDMAEALEDEVLALREQTEADLELAQLGMAIQVINHEFDHTVKSIRSSIRELRAWADANEALRDVYENIRRNFDHLDSYLTLFTPLQRRLYRKRITFTGSEIFKFLRDLFQERMERLEVSFNTTAGFRHHRIFGYPSTFYPVFVNIVDNALYWLDRTDGPREIRIDILNGNVVVMNTGPAIASGDQDEIFEQGFSRKPGGRGLGLHISRQVLAQEGYTLRVVDPPAGMGAAFSIERTDDVRQEEE